MGFFSFSNEFEVAVNQPKKTVYQEIISYIEEKDWDINSLTQLEKISFQTSMTLTSYPIEFNLILKSVNETSTKLFVYAKAGQVDMGRSKRIIDEMLNECFGEQDFNIEDEDTSDVASSVGGTSTSGNVSTKDLHKDVKPSQAELDYERSVRSNTIIKSLIVGVIIFVGIIVLAEISSYEDTSSYEETKQENFLIVSEDTQEEQYENNNPNYTGDYYENHNSANNSIIEKVCPHCSGTGKMEIRGGGIVLATQQCPVCCGLGYVRVPTLGW